jgi:hypothetical protein
MSNHSFNQQNNSNKRECSINNQLNNPEKTESFKEGEKLRQWRRVLERERRVTRFDLAIERASPSPVRQAREG